jgi:hypothetical protein
MFGPKRGLWVCLAMSGLVTLLVGGSVLFAGRTFIPTDFMTSLYPWGGRHATDAYVKNRVHQDILEFDTMHAIAAGEAVRQNRLWLWNPYILCGTPAVGDPQLGTFYLPRLLLLRLFRPLRALDLLMLLHLLAAGPAMYALARAWGMERPAALTSALVWTLCGAQMTWFKYAGGGAAAVGLPLMALALRRGLKDGSVREMAAAGAVWALMFLGAHPHLSFLALVWAAVSTGAAVRDLGWRRAARAGAAFSAVGAGLAAVQLLPFLASLLTSQKSTLEENLVYARPTRTPLLLVTLIWQRAFGSPIDRLDLIPRMTGSNFFDFQGYVGLLPLVLAVAAWKRSRLLWGVVLVSLAIAVCYPLWWLVRTVLPFLSVFDPHRLYLYSFVLALLAGLGHQELLDRPPPRRLRLLGAGGAGAVVLVGATGALVGATWISIANPSYAALAIASAACAAGLLAMASSWSPRAKAAVLWVAVAADLLPGFLAYNATYEAPPPEPSLLARLPRDERVVVDVTSDYYQTRGDNFLMMHGLSTPSGYVSQYPRVYQELVGAIGGVAVDHGVRWTAKDERALKLLNVRVVVTRDGERRLDALPRAWLVGRAEVRSSSEERLRRLGEPDFDPARTAILEEAAPPVEDGPSAAVERIGPDRFRVDAPGPRLLVTSETFDPGWICDVDGARRPVLRINHAMRGVALEAGRHEVVFRYRPPTVLWGAIATAGTAVVLGWLLLRKPDPR